MMMNRDGAADALRERTSCTIVGMEDEGYDEDRRVFNAAIDSRPLAIAYPRDSDDVQSLLGWAQKAAVPISIRGGGHGVHGLAVRDGGLVLDMSAMSEVTVDPFAHSARVGAGARWSAVYSAAAEHSLVPVGGSDSRVGVVGFITGSGNAWLMRRHGLACDNVISIELVTPDGRVAEVGPDDEDLFWAQKGGGGNFGVITAVSLQLHPAPPRIVSGMVFFAAEDAAESLRGYRAAIEKAPRDTAAMWIGASIPDTPHVPEVLRGRRVACIAMVHAGSAEEAEWALDPLRHPGVPSLLDTVSELPLAEAFGFLDQFSPEGMLQYWRGAYLESLEDETISAALPVAMDTDEMCIQVWQMGGAVGDHPLESAAIPRDRRKYYLGLASSWRDSAHSQQVIAGTDAAADAFAPWVSGACPNHSGPMSPGELRAALGDRIADRLLRVKREHDPTNVFSSNQNIAP